MSNRSTLRREGDELVVRLGGYESREAFDAALVKLKMIPGKRFEPSDKSWRFRAEPIKAQAIIQAIYPDVDAEIRQWIAAELREAADALITNIPTYDREQLTHARAKRPEPPDDWEPTPGDDRYGLYQHQVDAVGFLLKHPRALVADDMGLGKTVESIVASYEADRLTGGRNPESPLTPKLVVSTGTYQGSWARHLREWDPGVPVHVIPGKKPAPKRHALLQDAIREGGWIVTTWEQIRAQKIELTVEDRKRLLQEIQEAGMLNKAVAQQLRQNKYRWVLKERLYGLTEFGVVIADEAHKAKNKDAQQTRGLWQLRAPMQLALTGTPILNSPDELWPLLAWLVPEAYGEFHPAKMGYEQFYETYVDYYENGRFGKVVTGVKNPDDLRYELSDKLVRRTKGQVLKLPGKGRKVIPIELNPKQRKMYDDARKGLWVAIEQAVENADPELRERIAEALERGDVPALKILMPNAAARMVRLEQISSSPALLGGPDDSAKFDAAVEIASDLDKPVVIFVKHRDSAALLAERLRKRRLEVGVLTGDTPAEQRTTLEEDFQSGKLNALVLTLEAGGESLTLTAADTAIFVNRLYVAEKNKQAEDRLHRIGQAKRVTAIILEAVDTVDDGNIAPKNAVKELIVSSVIAQDHVETEGGTIV